MSESTMDILFHGIGEYRPEMVIGPSEWKHHDILMAYRGEVFMEAAGRGFHMVQGDVLMIPPHNPFVGHAVSESARIWVVHFKNYVSPYNDSKLLKENRAYVVREAFADPFFMDGCRRFHDLYQNHNTSSQGYELQALLKLLLVQLEKSSLINEEQAQKRKQFDPLLEWAASHVGEGVQVSDLASRAGLSESHFRVRFREAHGVSPSAALQEIRIREARQLLRDTDTPIKRISELTGYADLVSFHRAFTRAGQTPAQYRLSVRNRV